jgi:hypothetical protein
MRLPTFECISLLLILVQQDLHRCCHQVLQWNASVVLIDALMRVQILRCQGGDELVLGQQGDRGDLWRQDHGQLSSADGVPERTNLMHAVWNSSAEKQRLPGDIPSIRQSVQDLHQLVSEALIEQTVGFIEDETTFG